MSTVKTPLFNDAAEKATPEAIVNEAIDVLQKMSIQNSRESDGSQMQWAHTLAGKMDWGRLRAKALEELHSAGPPTMIDVCGAIDRAVMRLHDRHSLISYPGYRRTIPASEVENIGWPAQKQKLEQLTRDNGLKYPRPQPLPTAEYAGNGDILHLTVPSFVFSSPGADKQAFQDTLINALKDAAKKNIRGVIVDLRENSGGSMSPMITGLSPLLGPGTLGYFAGPDSKEARNVNYGPPEWRIDLGDPGNFPLTDIPVAVLCGPTTTSSGEITFLSFSGRPNTRSFGQPTDGNSSGNASGQLETAKDLWLHITASIALDRNGKGDGGPLTPDVVTKQPLEAAIGWIEQGAPSTTPAASRPRPRREPGL